MWFWSLSQLKLISSWSRVCVVSWLDVQDGGRAQPCAAGLGSATEKPPALATGWSQKLTEMKTRSLRRWGAGVGRGVTWSIKIFQTACEMFEAEKRRHTPETINALHHRLHTRRHSTVNRPNPADGKTDTGANQSAARENKENRIVSVTFSDLMLEVKRMRVQILLCVNQVSLTGRMDKHTPRCLCCWC